MIVACPQCEAKYNIPDEKIGIRKRKATCRKCGEKIVVEPPELSKKAEEEVVFADSREIHFKPAAAVDNEATLAVQEYYPRHAELLREQVHFDHVLTPDKKGRYKTADNALKLKVLQAVSEKLASILLPDEWIFKVGQGIAYYPSELLFGNGVLTLIYNNYAILCTNRRILLCNISYRNTILKQLFFQIHYGEIKQVKRGLLGRNLVFIRKKGKKRIFQYLRRNISAEIKEFVESKLSEVATTGEGAGRFLENLCPNCFVPLHNGLENCSTCNAGFKRPAQAMIRSLLLPGWGDIYLGHRLLGGIEFIGALLVWFIVISILLGGGEGALVIAFFLLLFVNGTDAVFTWFMGKKGYMVSEKPT